MYAFDYIKAGAAKDAAAVLTGDDEAKVVAGGMTLIPTLKQRLAQPSQLVDLAGAADMRGVSLDGGVLKIGAMTRHAEVASSDVVKGAIPALAALAEGIGDPQVRNRGTIGGSLANNDPAADYPGAILGLGATIHTTKRDIAADAFITGMFETALAEDELITAVSFPKPKRAAYAKFPNPASRYAIVGAFAAEAADGVRLAITGAGPNAFRATALEEKLKADFAPAALEGASWSADGLNEDIHATADYRAHLVVVMAKRAVAAAIG